MNRSLQLLLGVCVLLAAGVGYGMGASSSHASATAGGQRLPVQSTTAVCQSVGGTAAGASTLVSGFVPQTNVTTTAGKASVAYAATKGRADGTGVLSVTKVGTSVTTQVTTLSDPNAGDTVLGQASGELAPGFTLDQTLSSTVGPTRGLAGRACEQPGTDFWFTGAQGGQSVSGDYSYLYLSNTSTVSAQYSVTLYGANGQINVQNASGLALAGDTSTDILLGTFDNGSDPIVAVHVQVSLGTLSAAMGDQEAAYTGNDFVPAAAEGTHLVIPGIPAAKMLHVILYLLAPDTDANVSLHWIGHNTIVPAGNATVAAPTGQLKTVDLTNVWNSGEAAALELDSQGGAIVAGVKIVYGTGNANQDVAFLGAASQLTSSSIVSDNRSGGGATSTLVLTAPGQAATAQVTSVGPSGTTATTSVPVPAGGTVAVTPNVPGGATEYAVEVTKSGGGPLYGARVLTIDSGSAMITAQELEPARVTVEVPNVSSDLSGLVPQ